MGERINPVKHVWYSNMGDLTFTYEAPKAWHQSPLETYSSSLHATYPPSTQINPLSYERYGMKVEVPMFDLIVFGKQYPLVLTGSHNRLLYECKAGLLRPNPERVLVIADEHDDFELGAKEGYDPNNVHAGNWVSAGIMSSFWTDIIHLSHKNNGRERSYKRIISNSGGMTVDFHQIDISELTAEKAMLLLDNRPFIYTVDADEFANRITPLSDFNTDRLRRISRRFFNTKTIELAHFTPSNVFCPPKYAEPQWNVLRKEYLM